MAILFNPQALNAFAKFNVGSNDAIANVGEGGNLVQKKELGSVLETIAPAYECITNMKLNDERVAF